MTYIYGPAEDTWLTVRAVEKCVGPARPRLCIDVGSGGGYVTQALSGVCGATVAVDLNPAACCASKAWGDSVCCDALFCVVGRGDMAVVSNMPYLPPEEKADDWEALAIYDYYFTERLLSWVAVYRPRLVVLTTSTLGLADHVETSLRQLGYRTIHVEKNHMFFEDIVALCAEG